MIVIAVARKPNDGTVAVNSITWGPGGFNIRASRVGTEPVSVHGYPGQDVFGVGGKKTHFQDPNSQPVYESHHGRWPANLILEHFPDCQKVGTCKIKGTSAKILERGPQNSMFESRLGGNSHPGFAGADGMEAMDDYECNLSCPVEDMDRQGKLCGVHSAGSYRPPGLSVSKGDPARWMFGTLGLFVSGARVGDQGQGRKASRFFKQVRP